MPRRSISYVLVKISYWDNQAPLGIKLFKRMSFNGEDTPNEIVLILIHCTAIHYGAAEHPICFIDVFCSCCSFCMVHNTLIFYYVLIIIIIIKSTYLPKFSKVLPAQHKIQ